MPRKSSPPKAPRRRADGRHQAGAGRAPRPHERVLERVHERDLLCVCGLAAVEALFSTDPGRVERLFFEPRLAGALARSRRALAKTHKPYRECGAGELARVAGPMRPGA